MRDLRNQEILRNRGDFLRNRGGMFPGCASVSPMSQTLMQVCWWPSPNTKVVRGGGGALLAVAPHPKNRKGGNERGADA